MCSMQRSHCSHSTGYKSPLHVAMSETANLVLSTSAHWTLFHLPFLSTTSTTVLNFVIISPHQAAKSIIFHLIKLCLGILFIAMYNNFFGNFVVDLEGNPGSQSGFLMWSRRACREIKPGDDTRNKVPKVLICGVVLSQGCGSAGLDHTPGRQVLMLYPLKSIRRSLYMCIDMKLGL